MSKKSYNKISKSILKEILFLVGKENVLTDKESLINYGHDENENLSYPPEVLVKPKDADQVSKIMQLAFKNTIPVTPIGARTGLSGGSLSIHGGIGLSMERFNKILEIDQENLQVHVQPGVITQVLQEEVAKKGLYYAPDPASRGSCFIGGNIAENSGGPIAVKYGVTKDFVLNLEVVLPNGDIIKTCLLIKHLLGKFNQVVLLVVQKLDLLLLRLFCDQHQEVLQEELYLLVLLHCIWR